MSEPINGTCCGCGYTGEEETPCPHYEDGSHCPHWWEGPDYPSECDNCPQFSTCDHDLENDPSCNVSTFPIEEALDE